MKSQQINYPRPDITKFCPDCGWKTLEGYKGFTYFHCLNCGYFFKVDRELTKPTHKSCYMDNMGIVPF